MERYSMLMDKKTQFCQDISFFQFKIYTQYNPNQNPANYFMDVNKLILKFTWKGRKTPIANSVLTE